MLVIHVETWATGSVCAYSIKGRPQVLSAAIIVLSTFDLKPL